MNLVEEEDTDEDDEDKSLGLNELSDNEDIGVTPGQEDGSVASAYRSNSTIMTGGRAYAALAAAGHRLRKSKKTGRKTGRKTRHRKTRHRKTRHRKTSRKTARKTNRRS